MTDRTRRVIVDALEIAPASLQAIADEAGVSYRTLWGWKSGRRNPLPENLTALAAALERRGGEMTELAQKLRKAAGE